MPGGKRVTPKHAAIGGPPTTALSLRGIVCWQSPWLRGDAEDRLPGCRASIADGASSILMQDDGKMRAWP